MPGIERPLRRLNLSNISEDQLSHFLINRSENKAIKIPANIRRILEKFSNPQGPSGLASDLLAMAIAYRRASNITNILENWEHNVNSGVTDTLGGGAFIVFRKYIRVIFSSDVLANFLTQNEIRNLISFFSRCPHGYKVPEHFIKAHSEFKPIIT